MPSQPAWVQRLDEILSAAAEHRSRPNGYLAVTVSFVIGTKSVREKTQVFRVRPCDGFDAGFSVSSEGTSQILGRTSHTSRLGHALRTQRLSRSQRSPALEERSDHMPHVNYFRLSRPSGRERIETPEEPASRARGRVIPASGRIAVKVIHHLGEEVMKVFRV